MINKNVDSRKPRPGGRQRTHDPESQRFARLAPTSASPIEQVGRDGVLPELPAAHYIAGGVAYWHLETHTRWAAELVEEFGRQVEFERKRIEADGERMRRAWEARNARGREEKRGPLDKARRTCPGQSTSCCTRSASLMSCAWSRVATPTI